MENDTFTTTQEWEQHLGSGIRELRKRKQLTQADLAASANVSLSSIKRLEEGDGSSMSTVIRVVRALERKEWLSQLVPPAPSISPLAIYRASQQSTSKKSSRRSRPQVSGTSP